MKTRTFKVEQQLRTGYFDVINLHTFNWFG